MRWNFRCINTKVLTLWLKFYTIKFWGVTRFVTCYYFVMKVLQASFVLLCILFVCKANVTITTSCYNSLQYSEGILSLFSNDDRSLYYFLVLNLPSTTTQVVVYDVATNSFTKIADDYVIILCAYISNCTVSQRSAQRRKYFICTLRTSLLSKPNQFYQLIFWRKWK